MLSLGKVQGYRYQLDLGVDPIGGDLKGNLVNLCNVCHRQIHLRAEISSRPERGEG